MAAPADDDPIDDAELGDLFAGLERTPLALAVSGGADSMALMHLVARWLRSPDVERAWHAQSPLAAARPTARPTERIVVATVDHGLRSASADDAGFVADQARSLGFPCQILRWTGDKPATGVQAAAREARYRLLRDAITAERACDCPARVLVTAHHRDDVAETFLMRLARGSGIDGLSAIQKSTVRGWPQEGTSVPLRLVRPLLDVPKVRLVATLRGAGHAWREDPSNDNASFERVRVRRALEVLEELGISRAAIGRSAQRLRRAERTLDTHSRAKGRHAIELHGGMFAEIRAAFAVDGREDEMALRWLRPILQAFGGQPMPVRLSQVEDLWADVRAWQCVAADGQSHRRTLAGCIVDCQSTTGVLRIWREPGRRGLPVCPIEPGQQLLWDRRFVLSADAAAPSGAIVRSLGEEGWGLLLERMPALTRERLPRAAVMTLPAIWLDEALITVPYFDKITQGSLYTASFVGRSPDDDDRPVLDRGPDL